MPLEKLFVLMTLERDALMHEMRRKNNEYNPLLMRLHTSWHDANLFLIK